MSGWFNAFEAWLSARGGLFNALTALGALGAAFAAFRANKTTRTVLQDERASRRPWLAVNETATENIPGAGFAIAFRLQNYGNRPAVRPRLTCWLLLGIDQGREIDDQTMGADIVPNQQWSWQFYFGPNDMGQQIGIRIQYAGIDGKAFEDWLFFEWPHTGERLLKHLLNVNAETSDKLRERLDGGRAKSG